MDHPHYFCTGAAEFSRANAPEDWKPDRVLHAEPTDMGHKRIKGGIIATRQFGLVDEVSTISRHGALTGYTGRRKIKPLFFPVVDVKLGSCGLQ